MLSLLFSVIYNCTVYPKSRPLFTIMLAQFSLIFHCPVKKETVDEVVF